MTRDELQDVATRVCLAIAAGADVADVFGDARSVAVALATLALDAGALVDPDERRRAGDRRRQERRRAKKRDSVTPESLAGHGPPRDKPVTETVTVGVTERDETRDTIPPQTPLPEEHPSFPKKYQQKEGGNARDVSAGASRPASRRSHGESVTDRDAHSDATRWCGLLDVFHRVVHNGMPSVPQALARQHLTNLLPALDARAKGKPLEFFEAVLRPYDAHKRASGKVPQLEFFCRDFAAWADAPPAGAPSKAHTMSEPVVPLDEREQRIRNLQGKLRDERALLDAANDATRARLRESVQRLERELEQLTTRAA